MRALVLCAIVAVGGAAQAQVQAPLSAAMQRHFDGERDEGYAWMGFGSASLVSGGILFKDGGDLERGSPTRCSSSARCTC